MRFRLTPIFELAVGSRQQAAILVQVALLALCCLLPPGAFAQPGSYTTTDKRAIKLYESGGDCMRQRKWACAQEDLEKAARDALEQKLQEEAAKALQDLLGGN